MSNPSRHWLSVLFGMVLLLLLMTQFHLLPFPLAQAAPPTQANPTTADAGEANAEAAQVEAEKAGWPQWEALPLAIKAKVDPRILAELRGVITPAYVATDLGSSGQPLLAEPQPREQTRFLVYLRQQADLTQKAQGVYASAVEQRQALFSTLIETAQSAQAALRTELDAELVSADVAGYQSFYIVNALAVEGNLLTLIRLAQRDDVARIAANYPLVAPFDGFPTLAPATAGNVEAALAADNWNIELVGADRVWSDLGIRGEGAVVAGFDTGVSYRHPALIKNYRGNLGNGQFNHNYNWFEPDAKLYPNGNLGPSVSAAPTTCHPHGTHTMGTSVGDGGRSGTQIGMAPAAQWIALPGICGDTMPGGLEDDIGALKAFQWVLCPTDLSGDLATADCSKAPDAVNNSWGSANPTNDVLRPAIQRLRELGVAPVFAAGNPWAGPGSIGTPGNAPEAITVGATDRVDQVASFSGRGPSFYEGEQKPELSAPGVDVKSSVYTAEYLEVSGTSMAAPHVTGLIALMVAADLRDGVRDFSVDELERFMELTAVDLGDPGADNDYGYGRINAYEAVRWVLSAGDLQGHVRDGVTGQTIASAQLKLRRIGTEIDFAAQGGPSGSYSITLPAGSYQLTVEAWGYTPAVFDAQVFANSLAVADLVLQPQATGLLQGVVRIEGTPVANALITVQAAPTLTVRSSADGSYSLTLPVGAQKLQVQAAGARITQVDLLVTPGSLSYDFALPRAPTILLVDADAYGGWFFSWSVINVFRWALDQQRYSYDTWRIQYPDVVDTQAQLDGSTGYGVPSATTLRRYDVVIWAHSGCGYGFFGCSYGGSPSNINADTVLIDYLNQGGKLILSGQNIGAEDDGTTLYDQYLQADWLGNAEVDEDDMLGGKNFLQDLHIKLTNASLYGYSNGFLNMTPDVVAPGEGNGVATPILFYEKTEETAALAVSSCQSDYRAIYFAMGYENIGPRAATRDPAAAALLDKSITWTLSPKPDYSFAFTAQETERDSRQGRSVTYAARLINAGAQSITVQLAVGNNRWPTRIYDGATQVTGAVALAPCENRQLTVVVDVPADAPNGSRDDTMLTARMAEAPEAAQTVNVQTTAFAPWVVQGQSDRERYGVGAVALTSNYQIFVIGGREMQRLPDGTLISTAVTAAVESFNPCTGQWRTHAGLPVALYAPAVATLNGKIYVVGGYTDLYNPNYSPESVFVYDPAQDRWSRVADLPHYSTYGITMTAANGKLYTFGGYDDQSFIAGNQPTYEYDPVTNRWMAKAPMPLGRGSDRKVVAINDKIYVVGGSYGTGELDLYDPVADSWASLASTPLLRYNFGLAGGADGYLYVVGGGGNYGVNVSDSIRYNPQTNGWEQIPQLNDTRRQDTAAVYAAGQIFAIGGYGARNQVEALPVADSFCLSTQQASSNAAAVGGSVTYSVTLRPEVTELRNVHFSSQLPAEVVFAGFQGDARGAAYDASRRTVEWRGALSAASGPVRFTYRVDFSTDAQTAGQRYQNVATFDSGTGATFTRALSVAVLLPDFANSTKQVDRTLAATGDTMTYALQVRGRNMVGGPVQVRDPLPVGIEYVPESLSFTTGAGSYDAATRSIVWQGLVPPSPYVNISDDYAFGDSDAEGELPQVSYEWVELRGTGEEIGGGDVLVVCDLPIGFSFEFYGVKQTTFCVSANGFISFDPDTVSGSRNECPIGNEYYYSDSNKAVIGAIWSDLLVQDQIRYQTFGTAPNRYLVVQWSGVISYYSFSSREAEFELILQEDGTIRVQVRTIGGLAAIPFSTGLKNYTNSRSITYACNRSGVLHDKLAVNFVPPGGGSGEAAADIRFRVLGSADAGVNKNLVNTATFSTQSSTFERSVTTLMNPVDLAQTAVQVNKTEVVPNEEVTYQVTLRNTGLLTASNASAVMALPAGLTYVENSLTCSSGQCNFSEGALRWAGAVAPRSTVNLVLVARLTAPLADLTPLVTAVQVDDGFGNQYTMPITVVSRRSDLHFSYAQVVPDFVDPGESATVVIYARNTGRLATTAQLAITVPVGASFEPSSLTCGLGSCTYAAGVITWNATLEPRVTTPIRFRITAPAEASYGDRYTGSITLTDVQWGDNYTYPASLWVAHGFYFASVGAPGQQFFFPAIFLRQSPDTFEPLPVIPTPTAVPAVPLVTPTPTAVAGGQE